MMKRIIAHTLALVVAALTLLSCLTACGGSASGFTFKNNDGVEIAIGASADEVIDKLGAHQSMNESASCGAIFPKTAGASPRNTSCGTENSCTPSWMWTTARMLRS